MGQIRLNGMEFYAYHGCYSEERLIGNQFIVDIAMNTDMKKPATTDNLCDALNYADVYEIVKQEMEIRSYLLENACKRIIDRLFEKFHQLKRVEVCIAKMHPPVGGRVHSVSVCQLRER